MVKNLKVDYDAKNVFSQVNYLNFGGLFSGHFRKVFLYDRLAKDGGLNTFANCEFATKKVFENGKWENAEYIANFTLFIAKNGSVEYIDKNGENGKYIDFHRLNAVGVALNIDDLMQNAEQKQEQIYNDLVEGYALETPLNQPLVLGFCDEEYQGKKGLQTRILLDRVFNSKLQSLEEQRENKEAKDYLTFKVKHKALEVVQNVNFNANESQSYEPYKHEPSQESKKQIDFNEAFTELREDNSELPF